MNTRSLLRTLVLAQAVLLLSIICIPSAHGAPGDLDLSFDPGSGVNAGVHAVALQADGKVVIGGEFSTVKGLSRIGVARLNADGSGDSSFDAGSVVGRSAGVYCVAFQPDGKWLIGGSFSTARGALRSYLARLNGDGSLDDTFHPPAFGADSPYQISVKSVRSISLQPDGKVLITGDFSEIGDTIRWGFARLNADGSLDASFAPNTFQLFVGPGGVDAAVVQADGRILIGGTFTEFPAAGSPGSTPMAVSIRRSIPEAESAADSARMFWQSPPWQMARCLSGVPS
jgi:uncharacterized delta-60 repeat protein